MLKKQKNKLSAVTETAESITRSEFLDYSYDESRVLYKCGFEYDLGGWLARGPEEEHYDYGKYLVKVERTEEEAQSGSKCMKITDRVKTWNGAILDITSFIREDITEYEAMVWVKIRDGVSPCRVNLCLQTNAKVDGVDFPWYGVWDDYSVVGEPPHILSKYRLPVSSTEPVEEVWENRYPEGYTTDDGWVLLRGKTKIKKCHYDRIYAYLDTSISESSSVSTQDIYVDNFVLLIGKEGNNP
ncbi:MAG: carbohydrate binding domain-containing protein [Oscillospiraceae bacterium]|nr:carbohydrate binding domain-containing protein [Oscillospiraceae bacterium]